MNRLLARQRGVAVITALLLTTLAITIVASLFWQQQVQVRSIENQRLQLQKQWILRGALDWARVILQEDASNSAVDHLGEPWAVPLAASRLDQFVENGRADSDASDATLSGSIIDAQSRYNLNNLATNGIPDPKEIAGFQRLLTSVRVNPALATIAASAIAATQTKLPNASGSTSAAAPVGTGTDGPRPISFEQVDDLLAVPGFTPDVFNKLKDMVVVLPRTLPGAAAQMLPATPVNVNTATAEVLAAKLGTLSLAEAAALVASRDPVYFKDPADFWTRAGKPAQDGADTRTSYFLVNGKVRLGRASLEVQALLDRTNGSPKIIWIREN